MRTYKYVSMQAGQTGKQLSTQARQARKYVCQSREHVNTQTSHLADFLFFSKHLQVAASDIFHLS